MMQSRPRYRVVLVDGEFCADRCDLRRLLLDDPELELVGECPSTTRTSRILKDFRPEVVLLDVDSISQNLIPEFSAFGPRHGPVVIALASDESRAMIAFRIHALDFLVKPVREERLRDAIHWAKSEAQLRRRGTQGNSGGDVDPHEERPGRVLVKTRGRVILLRMEDISWVEAQGGYVRIHTQGAKYLLREKISGMLQRLPPDTFVRIHRSAIVNLDSIKELVPHRYGSCTVVLKDGTQLVMSRTFREDVMHRFVDESCTQVY
ncbi:MAG: LytTR family DNA-binding domain-containing protein [Bacteroidota bacterium]